MNPAHLHILQHALGADSYGRKADPVSDDSCHGYHRKHFVTGPGSKDWDHCQELTRLGYLRDRGTPGTVGPHHHLFTVTPAGVTAMRQHSPQPPKLTRSQRRYACFRDVFPHWAFRDFLTFLKNPENRRHLPDGI